MSLATFKKKSIYSSSRAAKRSGKPTNEYWMYSGPYGLPDTTASAIFNASLVGPNGMVGGNYYNASNAGFSITGASRNIGSVGQTMHFSKSATPYRGQYPVGWGGTRGRYPDGANQVSWNIQPVLTGVAIQNAIVKPPVLSTKGMLERRFRWIHSGKYPTAWVQPVYSGNQTDTASQGLYVQNKSAIHDCHDDVNNSAKYVGFCVNPKTFAPYTKNLYQPRDASEHTLRIQRRCQDPLGPQKPFPYAVQTGTGVLRGGISVSNVANACNTSNTTTVPPAWYLA